MPKNYVSRRDEVVLEIKLIINREVDQGEWRDTISNAELVETVRAGLYRTFANPEREDAGITRISYITVEHPGLYS